MAKRDIEKAKKLINSNAFNEAERFLLALRKKEKTSKINYLLGYIHHININGFPFSLDKKEKKFKGSKEDARRFLGEAIDLEEPIEDAFWRLADIEDNKKHAVRILKKGLEHFPNSESIYNALIDKSESNDVPKICKEIEDKNIISNTLYFKLYDFFLEQKNYKEALNLIEKIKDANKDEKQFLSLIKGFCLYELPEIEKAKSIFKKLVEDDVNKKLNYAQYIGLWLCFLEKKETESVADLIKELPCEFTDLFAYVGNLGGLTFEKYFYQAIERSLSLFKTKKDYKKTYAKLKGIKALKVLENSNVNKKMISELKTIRNSVQDKKIFDVALIEAYRKSNRHMEAFELELTNTTEYSNYESQAEFILDEASKEDLKKITALFLVKLNNTTSWQRDGFKEILKNIIPIIFDNKDYDGVVKISSYFSEGVLEETDVLFEVAYAYSEMGDSVSAKKFYEKIWKKQPSSAVANNLGLLYENENNNDYAKKLFEKATELGLDNGPSKKNLQRIKKKLEDEARNIEKLSREEERALEMIKKEGVYIHERIFYLMGAEGSNQYIVASYNQLSAILRVAPEKAQELIKIFQQNKYISKIQNHNIDTRSNVYHVNPLVREFVLKRKKRIEENKPLALIGEKISIDSLELLGLDQDLLQKIDLKISEGDLKDILKRDLQENALALLTESYKAALVLSGSIIEALILYKVRSSNIVKYLPSAGAKKNKKVIQMDLSELLFVASDNKIIDTQLYHFSQALKHYRNLIHPAVEIRKSKVKKDIKDDADIAWGITKKIISEI